jgi:hypothetical protein
MDVPGRALSVKNGWMFVTECECSPGRKIAFTQAEMGDANIGRCINCDRPHLVLGEDGHLYAVGKVIIKNAEA